MTLPSVWSLNAKVNSLSLLLLAALLIMPSQALLAGDPGERLGQNPENRAALVPFSQIGRIDSSGIYVRFGVRNVGDRPIPGWYGIAIRHNLQVSVLKIEEGREILVCEATNRPLVFMGEEGRFRYRWPVRSRTTEYALEPNESGGVAAYIRLGLGPSDGEPLWIQEPGVYRVSSTMIAAPQIKFASLKFTVAKVEGAWVPVFHAESATEPVVVSPAER